MTIHRYALSQMISLGFLLSCCCLGAQAQNVDPSLQLSTSANALEYKVRPGIQRMTMYVNSTKILRLEGKQIPRALVDNPQVINAIAISPNQIQLSGLKAGVTRISLWDEETELYTVDVVVYGDAKELELLLETEFPNSSLAVRPLASSVVISGWVDSPEIISRVVTMAEDYYPKVINNIRVGDNQQVMLHVQVMEVSRTKIRQLGIDWAAFGETDFLAQNVSQLIAETTSNSGSIIGASGSTLTFGLADGNSSFFGVLDALRQNDLVKVLAEPVLTTVSGRPAAFNAGGEFPILIPQGLGTVAVEYKNFGTRVDFVPIVLGNGNIRLEVRPQVSEIDNARGVDINGIRVPGLRNRWVDTAVEMRAGQTLALAGLIQDRTEAQVRALPVVGELPWFGSLFRRVENINNEIELLVMVRPEFVDAMDPHQVPKYGPGEQSEPPNDVELYMRGYMEVPTCCPDGSCVKCRPGRGQFAHPETIPTPNLGGAQQIEVLRDEPIPLPEGEAPAETPATPTPPEEARGPGLPMNPAVRQGRPFGMPFGMRAPTAKPDSPARPKFYQSGISRAKSAFRGMASRSRWGR